MVAFELPDVSTGQVRHSAVARLAEQGLLSSDRHVFDEALPKKPIEETERFVEALAARIGWAPRAGLSRVLPTLGDVDRLFDATAPGVPGAVRFATHARLRPPIGERSESHVRG